MMLKSLGDYSPVAPAEDSERHVKQFGEIRKKVQLELGCEGCEVRDVCRHASSS